MPRVAGRQHPANAVTGSQLARRFSRSRRGQSSQGQVLLSQSRKKFVSTASSRCLRVRWLLVAAVVVAYLWLAPHRLSWATASLLVLAWLLFTLVNANWVQPSRKPLTRFDPIARQTLMRAEREAQITCAAQIQPEHLLLAQVALDEEDHVLDGLWGRHGVCAATVRRAIAGPDRSPEQARAGTVPFSAESLVVLSRALRVSGRRLPRRVTAKHLAAAVLEHPTSQVPALLTDQLEALRHSLRGAGGAGRR